MAAKSSPYKTVVLDLPADVTDRIDQIAKRDRETRGYRIPKGILVAEILRSSPAFTDEPPPNGKRPHRKTKK